ncbi:MAG: hypothetical protein ACFB10_01150 [Salibacteraceae bacterium]
MALVLASACRRDECDQPVPEIDLVEFTQFSRDSAVLVISFKDCDGDVGLPPELKDGEFRHNLFVEYFELQQGEWVRFDTTGTGADGLYYRVPLIDPEGSSKTLEGDISIKLGSYYNVFSPYDTVRYEIRLKDRSLNVSNVITTQTYVFPR